VGRKAFSTNIGSQQYNPREEYFTNNMKTIKLYELISFRLPNHWKEETTNEGNPVFFDSSNNTGTLRVSYLQVKESEASPPTSLSQLLNDIAPVSAFKNNSILPTGIPMITYQQENHQGKRGP
jgi:hypothetical protein